MANVGTQRQLSGTHHAVNSTGVFNSHLTKMAVQRVPVKLQLINPDLHHCQSYSPLGLVKKMIDNDAGRD
jgi:hypothetical protein